MSSQSYSSIGAGGRRRGTAHDDIDRSFYTVGQTLASIVNDPRASSQAGGFWGLAAEATQGPSLPPPPPPLDPTKYPPVSRSDLQHYIAQVHGAYERFERDRASLEAFDAQHQGKQGGGVGESVCGWLRQACSWNKRGSGGAQLTPQLATTSALGGVSAASFDCLDTWADGAGCLWHEWVLLPPVGCAVAHRVRQHKYASSTVPCC